MELKTQELLLMLIEQHIGVLGNIQVPQDPCKFFVRTIVNNTLFVKKIASLSSTDPYYSSTSVVSKLETAAPLKSIPCMSGFFCSAWDDCKGPDYNS